MRAALITILLLITPGVSDAADASSFSAKSSKWLTEGGSLYSLNANQWVEYRYTPLEAGQHTLNLSAKQRDHQNLTSPSGFSFLVDVRVNGAKVGQLTIPANNSDAVNISLGLTLPATESTIRLTWLNDAYDPGVSDANFQLNQVSIVPLSASPPIPDPPEPPPFDPADLDQNGHVGLLDLDILVTKLLEIYCPHADAPGC